MMNKDYLISKTDVAYLPDITEDNFYDIDHTAINEAYKFCSENNARSFCTYPHLIPEINSKNYKTRLCSVIDFPLGNAKMLDKVFSMGIAYQIGKKASASELDVVLHPNVEYAKREIGYFCQQSTIWQKVPMKVIVEIGRRTWKDIDALVYMLNVCNDGRIKFIKTNTGKLIKMEFEEKIEWVRHIKETTEIPIKISGGIESFEQMTQYMDVCGENTIFGVSYDKIKEWV